MYNIYTYNIYIYIHMCVCVCVCVCLCITYILHLFQRHQVISVVEHSLDIYLKQKLFALRKKCPNTEFFLVRIFLHSG